MEQTARRQEQLPGAFNGATINSQHGRVRWYLVHTPPHGKERETCEKVRRIIPHNLMQDAFVMQKEFWFKRDGAWSLQTKPMYKEYFFVATHDAAALDRALAQLSFGCRIAGSRERAYMPMPDDAQDWYRSVLDDDGVVRNSVARIEDGVLHIEQGPLVGQEARVKKIDRHKRWCLVDVGEGDSAFRELLPLDVPSKTEGRRCAGCSFAFLNLLIGGSLGDRDVRLTVAAKELTESNAPVGAALIAQAMDRREGAGRYKAMQSIVDWDRSRLAYRAVKRAFDIVFSCCALAVIAIPSLVLAAAIRLESEGNPFYSQIRVGQTHRDGSLSTFRMWKFRSMYKDADERLAELKGQNEIAGAMFKMREDPRVTKIGRFIRKHSIDEFPQFLNVFLGQIPLRILKTRPEFSEESMVRSRFPPNLARTKERCFRRS